MPQIDSVNNDMDILTILKQAVLEPFLYNVTGRSVPDPTFGRIRNPRSKAELVFRSKPYVHHDGIVKILSGPPESLTRQSLPTPHPFFAPPPAPSADNYVHYQIWYDPRPEAEGPLSHIDLVWCHGLGDYGGRFAEYGKPFLDAGARIILPDMPGFGRSTGVHGYLPSCELLTEGLHQVVYDIRRREEKGEDLGQNRSLPRKVVVGGGSMGGYTALSYAVKYGGGSPKGWISGVLALCPMTEVAKDTRPPYVVELVARTLIKVGLGRLPLSPANKGKNSANPQNEIDFQNDPQTYHGWLRISTGLAFLQGMDDLDKSIHLFPQDLPLLIIHGSNDRVVDLGGSKRAMKRIHAAGHPNARLEVMENCEHDLMREPPERRDKIIEKMVSFIVKEAS